MPSKKFFNSIDMKQNSIKNLAAPVDPNDAVTKAYVDGGSSASALSARVEKLENQAATILKTFTEDYSTATYINNALSTDVVRVVDGSDSYVRANRQYQYLFNNAFQANLDTATSISYTPSGSLQLLSGQTVGQYISNYHTIDSTTSAWVQADINQVTANTFGDEVNITVSGLQTDTINFISKVDSQDRRWYFYQNRTNSRLYTWAEDLNGNVIVSHREIDSSNTFTSALPSITKRTLGVEFDNNNNIWISVGRGNSTNARLIVYKIAPTINANATLSTLSVTTAETLSWGSILGVYTFFDSVENAFHMAIAGSGGTGGNQQLRIYNCTNNTVYASSRAAFNTTPLSFEFQFVRISSTEMALLMFNDSNTNALRGMRYSLASNGPYGAAISPSTLMTTFSSASSCGVARYVLNGSTIVGLNIRNGGTSMEVVNIPSNFTASANYSVVAGSTNTLTNAIVVPNNTASDGFSDGTHIHIVYRDGDATSSSLYYSKVRFDGSILETNNSIFNRQITPTATNNQVDALPEFDTTNEVTTLFYIKTPSGSTTSTPAKIVFGNATSKVKFEVQLGSNNWVTVFDNTPGNNVDERNKSLTLGSIAATTIRTRWTLYSPNASNMTPSVDGYRFLIPNTATGGFQGVLVTNSLINDRIIGEVTLTADVVNNDGTVSFYASNRGGASGTWEFIEPNTKKIFSTIGSDLRVKIVIAVEGNNVTSPRVHGFTAVSGNVAQQSDLVVLNVNLMKTTLQLTTLLTAQRLSWTNMMVDTFQDGTGVNLGAGLSLSAGTITGTGTVTSAIETAEINPVNSIVVVAESTGGTVTYQVSRDGGLTFPYTATPNTITVLDGNETTRNQICIRANLTGGASLAGWAYLYA